MWAMLGIISMIQDTFNSNKIEVNRAKYSNLEFDSMLVEDSKKHRIYIEKMLKYFDVKMKYVRKRDNATTQKELNRYQDSVVRYTKLIMGADSVNFDKLLK